uniref:Uncharacterized protein n=1 Tax=viral metagenome TaxID=1070528 RepID=A0A6M3KDR8_9ZZZZ
MEEEGKEYNWYTGKWEEESGTSTTTKPTCQKCGGSSDMDWKYCPYCGGLWEPTNGREI